MTIDNKADWYQILKGRTIAARPELTRELDEVANTQLVMLNVSSFLFHAREYLDAQVSAETIRQSEALPRLELVINTELIQHGISGKDSFDATKLLKRINSRRALVNALEEALRGRYDKDPDGLTLETKALQGQLAHARDAEQQLSNRLLGMIPTTPMSDAHWKFVLQEHRAAGLTDETGREDGAVPHGETNQVEE